MFILYFHSETVVVSFIFIINLSRDKSLRKPCLQIRLFFLELYHMSTKSWHHQEQIINEKQIPRQYGNHVEFFHVPFLTKLSLMLTEKACLKREKRTKPFIYNIVRWAKKAEVNGNKLSRRMEDVWFTKPSCIQSKWCQLSHRRYIFKASYCLD